jgi:hypothetical protein
MDPQKPLALKSFRHLPTSNSTTASWFEDVGHCWKLEDVERPAISEVSVHLFWELEGAGCPWAFASTWTFGNLNPLGVGNPVGDLDVGSLWLVEVLGGCKVPGSHVGDFGRWNVLKANLPRFNR